MMGSRCGQHLTSIAGSDGALVFCPAKIPEGGIHRIHQQWRLVERGALFADWPDKRCVRQREF